MYYIIFTVKRPNVAKKRLRHEMPLHNICDLFLNSLTPIMSLGELTVIYLSSFTRSDQDKK